MAARATLVLLLALVALAPEAIAGAMRPGGTLRVGTTGDYPPYTRLASGTGAYDGIDIAMARALAHDLGLLVRFVPTRWATLEDDLAAGRFDLAMGGISVTPERQKRFLFSIAYATDGKAAIARCAEQERYRGLAAIDRDGVRVIVNPGGSNERFDRGHLHAASVEVYPDNLTIFDRIEAGAADVMITDASEARYAARLHPKLCAIDPDHPFDHFDKAYLLPQDRAWKAKVDGWLGTALASGAYARIARNWFGRPTHDGE